MRFLETLQAFPRSCLEVERLCRFGRRLGIFLLFAVIYIHIGWAQIRARKEQEEKQPLAELLNPDGAMNLKSGYRGAISPKGWQMRNPLDRAPKFAPSGEPGDEGWSDSFGFPGPGVNSTVNAVALDGSGNLYIGGSFTQAGGVNLCRIAKWNSAGWSVLGQGLDFEVTSLAVDKWGKVYAAGATYSGGGLHYTRHYHIAEWNGASWTTLSSGYGSVTNLVLDGAGNLYAGGWDPAPGNVSKWNGSQWLSLGSAMEQAEVRALALDGSGNLYASFYSQAGGASAGRVAKWDGATWSPLGLDMNDGVLTLAVNGAGGVFAGGWFTEAGGVSAKYVAKWNGKTWSPLGSGVSDSVTSLAIDGAGKLYAGGRFTQAGETSANHIASWNGTGWSALAIGCDQEVLALAVSDAGHLYAGGQFTQAGGMNVNYIAEWNGTGWSALGSRTASGSGMNRSVYALLADGAGTLYAGGDFTQAGGVSANRIAKWNGTTWAPLGSGMNDAVLTLALDRSGNLYAGGLFTQAGGVSANRIAKWDGATWVPLGSGIEGSPSSLTWSPSVNALAADSAGNLYAGGLFTRAGNLDSSSIAKWNGTSWAPVGPVEIGPDIPPYTYLALAVDGAGNLFAGGASPPRGGSNGFISKWDGTTWSPLGLGFQVVALAMDGAGNLYSGAMGSSRYGIAGFISKWDGKAWSTIPTGSTFPAGMDGTPAALTVDIAGNLYVGGGFSQVGGMSVNHIAKWNGTEWSPLGSGMNGFVAGLAVDGAGNLYAGGSFTQAGGKESSYIGRWIGQSNPPPGKATLISPSGYISTSTTAYTWNAVQGASYYYLWVNESANSEKIQIWYTKEEAHCQSGSGTCSVTPSVALSPGAYQWWIQTWNKSGYGPWSDGMNFTVENAGPPGKATLISPFGSVTTTTPIFIWNPVPRATWYYLWVNDIQSGKIEVWYTAKQAGCESRATACSVRPSVALNPGACQWWIQTWNESGYGPWSDGMTFTIEGSGPPGKATLISPSGTITTTMPTFAWHAVPEATLYYLWVSDASRGGIQTWYTAEQAGCKSDTATCSVTPSTALGAGAFKWWIQTYNEKGYGPWSSPLDFTIIGDLVIANSGGNWGAHYDATFPNQAFPDMTAKFIEPGLAPQIFFWIPYTVILCGLMGILAASIGKVPVKMDV